MFPINLPPKKIGEIIIYIRNKTKVQESECLNLNRNYWRKLFERKKEKKENNSNNSNINNFIILV